MQEKMLEVLLENELGGDLSLALKFSDPDGVRTGKSGYSFGISQFDIENNWDGILCLRDCGFRPKDLNRLYDQNSDISDLNAKLVGSKEIIHAADLKHINQSIKWTVDKILPACKFKHNVSDEAIAHLIDYHNQFYISFNGKMHRWLKTFALTGEELTPADILNFKLKYIKWGRTRPDDVNRRYDNIRNVFK
jgi:hypothetical protein